MSRNSKKTATRVVCIILAALMVAGIAVLTVQMLVALL